MATDNSNPRNGLILVIAVASVFTLGTLKFVFDSYYRYVMEEEVAAKAAPPTELRAARLSEQQRLATGPMPIDKAMHDLAKSREALIQPQQSADDGPMVGWSKAPRPVAPAPVAALGADSGAAAAEDGGVTTTSGDGGAAAPTHAADGGATPNAALDGGHAAPQDKLQAPPNGPKVTDAGGGKKP